MITTVSRILVILSLCALYISAIAMAEDKMVALPGEVSQIVSPDGRWALVNIDSENNEINKFLGDNHALYLMELGSDKMIHIYSYARHVDILWSNGGSMLLINDYAGSNYSFPIVVEMNSGCSKINVKEKLMEQFPNTYSVLRSHHLYIEGTEWLNARHLKVEVHGYGDTAPNGFTLWFEYTIGNGFKQIE